MKERTLRDIKNFFEFKKDYYELVIVNNYRSNIYIEYKSNDHRNKTLSTWRRSS